MKLVTALLFAPMLWAQIETGSVVGTVSDQSGAKMSGVPVAIHSDQTGRVVNLETNQDGYYQSPPLIPGEYRVSAQRSGFKSTAVTIRVDVNQRVAADFKLEVGDVTQQIEISATAQGLETETSSLGDLRSEKAVADLPLNARNYAFLIGLAPGAVQTQDRSGPGALPGTSRRGVSNFSINGVRGSNDWNAILVEGVDNTENHNGLGSVIFPPVDAIQEFRVQTNSADAQFGRAAGGITNLVLKSGGKEVHGSLYEFTRNWAFDALNYFAKPGQDQKFILNQYGFTLGGPVSLGRLYNKSRDKTFFFASTQWDTRRQAIPNVSTVPTGNMRNGDFSQNANRMYDPLTLKGNTRTQFPGNIIPASRIDPVGLRTLALYPLPNAPGLVNNFVGAPVRLYDGYQTDIKIDHYFTSAHSIVFRASFGNTTINDGPVLPLPAASNIGATDQPVGQYAVIDRFSFAPNKLNEFRFGVTRFNLRLVQPNVGNNVASEIGIPGVNTGDIFTTGLPRISVTGYQVLGDDPYNPGVLVTNNFQTEDNYFWTVARHSLRMGARIDRRQYNAFQTNAVRGLMSFSGTYTNNPAAPGGTGNGVADLLLGAPISGSINILDGTRGFRRTELGFYLQDDWKATERLSLNLGLRYELYPNYPWTEVGNRMSEFVLGTGTLVPVGTGGVSLSGVSAADKNNWAPRIGLAYRWNEKTVVRSGFGVFYAAPQYEISRNLAVNPPFAGAFSFTNNQLDFASARKIEQGYDRTFAAIGSAPNGIDPALRMPYVFQWNLNVQRNLPGSMLLTVSYVGTKGVKLRDEVNINQAVPGPTAVALRRPYPLYGDMQYTEFRANSHYHGLQTKLERRLSKGLTVLISYSYAHAIDDAGQFGEEHQNVLDLNGDKGNAPFDIRHAGMASFNYDIPSLHAIRPVNAILGGWQVNGILRLAGGLPLTPSTAGNTLNGSGPQRPNVVSGCDWRLTDPTPLRWFNTACFVAPAPYTFGNAGRDIITGPGTHQMDASLFRNIKIRERYLLQFRAELFNLTNTPQFNQPNAVIGGGAGVISSAGSPPSFQRTSRQIQLALKLKF